MLERQPRQEAIESIPFNQLTEEARVKLSRVVSQAAIYRRLPVTVVETDPDLYVFLVRYPEVVVNIWDLMGVTKVQVQRTGDFAFEATDGAGTSTRVELVYGDRKTHVYYAEGAYDGPLLGRLIQGRCVLVLKTDYQQTEDGHVYATSRLDMFLQFDSIGAELLARTLHPLVGKSADHNFVESTRFLGQLSRAAEEKAIGMQQVVEQLTKVKPKVREQFALISALVNQRAATRGELHLTSRRDTTRQWIDDDDVPPSSGNESETTSETTEDAQETLPELHLRR
ncbi:MAG: hypothetical protein ACC628_19165 [Pirellulaceae bacterium]